jgi:hypothetical protein
MSYSTVNFTLLTKANVCNSNPLNNLDFKTNKLQYVPVYINLVTKKYIWRTTRASDTSFYLIFRTLYVFCFFKIKAQHFGSCFYFRLLIC